VRLDRIIPANEILDRTESVEFQFEHSEPPFNFSIGLTTFYLGNNVIDEIHFEELSKKNAGNDRGPKPRRTGYHGR